MSSQPIDRRSGPARGTAGLWRLGAWVVVALLVAFAAVSGAPASALERIDGIVLPADEDRLRPVVIDPAGEFAYFGTHTSPGQVLKIDLATFTRVDVLPLAEGEDFPSSALIDPAGEFAYFGTDASPGKVVKIDLATFTRVDALTLADGEDRLSSAVMDPAGEFAYFHHPGLPGQLVKIDLGTFTRVDALSLDTGGKDFLDSAAVIDPAGEFAYIGTITLPGQVLKIDLGTFTQVDTLTLDPGEDILKSAVIDPAGQFAYFCTDTSPGRVVKIDLGTFTRVDALTLADGESGLYSPVIDPAGEFAYFGTFTFPGRVVKIDLGTFTPVDALPFDAGEDLLASAVIDPAGEFAYFGTYTLPGQLVKLDLATFTRVDTLALSEGEEELLSAVIDPAGEFAYFGTEESPGQVVKIDLATFTRLDALTIAVGQEFLTSAVIDPAGEFAYFGAFEDIVGLGEGGQALVIKVDLETFTQVDTLTLTDVGAFLESAVIDPAGQFAYFGTDSFPGRVVKIDLADFTFVDSIVLPDGEDQLLSAVIDPAGEFAYFGTDTFPGQVIKIDLATLARVDALTLPDDEDSLASAVIDPAGEFAYFGSSGFPGRVIKIDLATFTRADALTLPADEVFLLSAVIDPGGELAYFGADVPGKGCGAAPGHVVEVDLETFTRLDGLTLVEGEVCLEAAVIDPGGEFAYFGTDTSPGRIVKIAVGAPGPELAYDPSSLDFGEVEVGTTGPPQSATLTNSGDVDATGLEFSLTGDSGFTVDPGACGDTVPAGGACEVVVTFGPDLVGELFAALEVTSAEGAAASLSLSGTGLGEILAPVGLTVDATPVLSDGNQVFEPGECVEVAPAWLWLGAFDLGFGGDALAFEGPAGPSYDLIQDDADYGVVQPGEIADCRDTDTCYVVQVGPSGVARPATHWDATLDEELFTKGDLPSWTWTLHIGESFVDVSRANPSYRSVETVLHHGVSGGCGGTEYCPAGIGNRAQMPVFVLRALEGPGYAPGACVEGEEVFDDVPATSPFCPWIEELTGRGVVAGCGGGNYCPGNPVTRAQMAIFLLKTVEGSSYTPPPCEGLFSDVTCPSVFAAWIEELFRRGITGGCGGDPLDYCPSARVNRAQTAVFVTKTFGLALYGP